MKAITHLSNGGYIAQELSMGYVGDGRFVGKLWQCPESFRKKRARKRGTQKLQRKFS